MNRPEREIFLATCALMLLFFAAMWALVSTNDGLTRRDPNVGYLERGTGW